MTSEIRYSLLNTIYKNKYFLPNEIAIIKELNFQIMMIGNNINQITFKLNSNKDLLNSDISILKNSIDELNTKIEFIEKNINKILDFADKRD